MKQGFLINHILSYIWGFMIRKFMADCISYKNISYYSDLIIDYLDKKEVLKPFYNRFPEIENFKAQILEKAENFPSSNREILVQSLEKQYEKLNPSDLTLKNIRLLKDEKTFCITTGHQLNLFTGPLYFFYKIISVINLTKELKQAYPDYNFVPMYWLAGEDHDFEEINFFNFKGKKHEWNSDQKGAVGRFSTKGLEKVFKEFKLALNSSEAAAKLENLFNEAYLKQDNLLEATRFLANEFFAKHGLVIIDGDDNKLKSVFAPYVKSELLHQNLFKEAEKTNEKLNDLNYHIQVNPREINLFYLEENSRERILKTEEEFLINNSEKSFSEEEILKELDNHPERFSPNAVMRPLYQESILPNLCYIGGAGELAYWFELKSYFEKENITFPVLLMRNSALLMSEKQYQKLEKLQLSVADLFLDQEELLDKKTHLISDIKIDFSPQKEHLKKQFSALYELAEKTDKSFLGAVSAQEKKQLNGLKLLEKRMLRAQKRVLKDELERVIILKDELFPNGNLQERVCNFSEFFEIYGEGFIQNLFEKLQPLEMKFDIIYL